MAEEPQQKKSEVQSVECEDRLLDMFPELVDSGTKVGQGSSEIGEAIQQLKLVSKVYKYSYSYSTIALYSHVQYSSASYSN